MHELFHDTIFINFESVDKKILISVQSEKIREVHGI